METIVALVVGMISRGSVEAPELIAVKAAYIADKIETGLALYKKANKPGANLESVLSTARTLLREADAAAVATESAEPDNKPDATAGAVKLAAENDVDLAEVKGTGAGGRITQPDVEQFLAKK